MNIVITKDGIEYTLNIANSDFSHTMLEDKIANQTSTWILMVDQGVKRMILLKSNKDNWETKSFVIEYADIYLNNINKPISSISYSFASENVTEYDIFFGASTSNYGIEQRKRCINGMMAYLFGFFVFDQITLELLPEFETP